jgi:uncharacterized protein YgiM (DUF1202 family)
MSKRYRITLKIAFLGLLVNACVTGSSTPANSQNLAAPVPGTTTATEDVALSWDEYISAAPQVQQSNETTARPLDTPETSSQPVTPETANPTPSTAPEAPPAQSPSTQPTTDVDQTMIQGSPTVITAEPTPIAPREAVVDPQLKKKPDLISQPAQAEESPEVDETGTYVVKVSFLNVRSGPSMQSPVVRTIAKGTKIFGTSREGIWIRTQENDYVSIHFLSRIAAKTAKN